MAYWVAQCVFWGFMFLISVVITAVWGTVTSAAVTVPLAVCVVSMIASHLLRSLYRRYEDTLSLSVFIAAAAAVVPLAALLVQGVIFLLFAVVVDRLSGLFNGFVAYQWSHFLAYVANTTMLLGLWAALYSLVSQYRRRRQTQAAYWRAQTQLRDTELRFLHSQINSHFLFNAISNLRALIREDPEAARAGLAQLADILRGVLQAGSHEDISISEEIELVRAYIALEALQLESRLSVEWAINENCFDARIPPLLIQTLVENAISHGIACRPKGGLLEIACIRNDSGVMIQVCNPLGSGPATRDGGGIGLVNARRRLASLSGRAELTLHKENSKMVATAYIPL